MRTSQGTSIRGRSLETAGTWCATTVSGRKTAEAGAAIDLYLSKVQSVINDLNRRQLAQALIRLSQVAAGEGRIFLCGNGGSATTAAHMAVDLNRAYKSRHARTRATDLSSSVASVTAIANDVSYAQIFVSQLEEILVADDILIGISVSGQSPNVVEAIRYANSRGALTIGLTGRKESDLTRMAAIAIRCTVPHAEYGPAEDVHLIINHIITEWITQGRVGPRFRARGG